MENGNGTMSKIYIITDGDYSDYHIVGVFDSKKLAKNFIKKYYKRNYGYPEIEEYVVNPLEQLNRKGCNAYFVNISQDGESLEFVDPIETTVHNFYRYSYDTVELYAPKIDYDNIDRMFYMTIWAKDKAHAKKIAIDKRREAAVKLGWKGLV